MKEWEKDLGVAIAESVIDPKLTGMARMYEGTIKSYLPEVVVAVVEGIDQAREMRAKAEANKDETK